VKQVYVTGLAGIIGNIKKAEKNYAKGCERGLVKAGLYLQRLSMMEVPVDMGVLRNSCKTRKVSGSGFSTVVEVAYEANYAIYVHERLDLKHKPGKKAKFLEDPLKNNQTELLNIVRDEMLKG
jgi:hypothetical protein